ncbi:MAG TPA: sodium:solute symporter [Thermoanaerobaculia bacterium]|nr:sodium:solute symporter [Thermoanaerobaculia bacterium]HUM29025.1 sodium:solute symporter [Thermoanaerobaculia bacterium]HXK67419.1 sodium:solute symporter [Thermoanaerobaculia bacterium]
MALKVIVLAVYALMIIVIGIMGLRKTRTFSDFFLGGGKVGPWMTAFTYGTAYFSAVLFIGFAGKIGWNFGYSGLWIALGNTLIGVLLVWWAIAPRVRRMVSEYGVTTMPEFFEKRYQSRFLKLYSPLCIFVFFVPYSAAVFIGLGFLFTSTFGIEYGAAMISMGLFTAIYLVLGGYRSMTMIDVIFGMIMSVGVLVLLWSTVEKSGGVASITSSLTAIHPDLSSWVGPPGIWPLFALVFLTSVAPMAMPQLIQKFYAIRDERAIRIGMSASTAFALLVCGVAYFTGATTRVLLSPETAPAAFAEGKPVYDALMPELLANVIHPSLSVVILLLILSASMSTLAALVLISSSSVAKDIYAGFVNPEVSDRSLTRLMRAASAFFILISVLLAYMRPATIVAILGISWGAIGSAFLGPFLWGLFWKKTSRAGATLGSLAALATCLILYFQGMPSPEAGTIGMMISLLACPVISLIAPGKPE